MPEDNTAAMNEHLAEMLLVAPALRPPGRADFLFTAQCT
jgi:hypothetical protein